MGAAMIYRKHPLLDYKTEKGSMSFYKYGSSKITGWRNAQEDRLINIPNYNKDFSFFAVYDGHGGNEVAEFLFKNFHEYLEPFLVEYEVELALQLSFLNFDHSIRNITEEEKASLLYVEVDDSIAAARDEFIAALKRYSNIASTSSEDPKHSDKSMETITSETLKFLTQDALASEEDEESENYKEGDILDNEGSSSDIESDSTHDDSSSICEYTPEADTDDEMPKSFQAGDTSDSDTDAVNSSDPKPPIGLNCGSTATVVLLNEKKVYVANVGDSRCIASIKGHALNLTNDHKPSDIEEHLRIQEAGSYVTDDDRIDGGLNMSRAFGDFAQKKKDDITQAIICDPYIKSIDVNEDLDFIVIASDGIWNSMSSQEVVDYINLRRKDAEPHDICEELFNFILAPGADGDGSGCDNMSIIIIDFNKDIELLEKSHVVSVEQELDTDNSKDSSTDNSDKNFETPRKKRKLDHPNVKYSNGASSSYKTEKETDVMFGNEDVTVQSNSTDSIFAAINCMTVNVNKNHAHTSNFTKPRICNMNGAVSCSQMKCAQSTFHYAPVSAPKPFHKDMSMKNCYYPINISTSDLVFPRILKDRIYHCSDNFTLSDTAINVFGSIENNKIALVTP